MEVSVCACGPKFAGFEKGMVIKMNYRLILLMLGSLAVALPAVAFLINRIERRDLTRNNTGASLYVKNTGSNPLFQLYQFLSRFPLTGDYVEKISRRYEIISPGDPKTIAAKTMKVTISSWVLCAAQILLIFILHPNRNNFLLAIYFTFVINYEVILSQIKDAEIKLHENMAEFVSDVSHNYYIDRMIDDAILLSMEGKSPEMRVHAQKIYEVITSSDMKEEVARYNASMHNKYLKMFLSLCTGVIEFSDKKIDGQNLFNVNLIHLKREINIEILKLKKLKHMFSGTVFTAVAVCAPINAIEAFGTSMVPELKSFYLGSGGIISVGIILASSITIYLLINNLKEMKNALPKKYHYLKKLEKVKLINKALDNYTEKNYGKMMKLRDALKRLGESISPRQLLLKQMLAAVITFSLCIGLCFYMHYCNRLAITGEVSNVEKLASSTNNKEQQKTIEDTILKYVNRYKKKQVTGEQILNQLNKDKTFYNTRMNEALSGEIVRRITDYQKEYFRWYELLVCIAVAVITFYIPRWMILYKRKILRMNMEDEVNQFNSIIYMLMYIEHICVKDLLEQMELFAEVFKKSIQECINEYNSGDIEALTKLKENEECGPFKRLVDNLIRCDEMPIAKAFDEIASDRENYHERRKQENEIAIQKRSDKAKLLSYIPAVLVTAYLMLPLLAASLKELEELRETLSSMGY